MNKKQNTEQQTRKTKTAESEQAVSLRHGLGAFNNKGETFIENIGTFIMTKKKYKYDIKDIIKNLEDYRSNQISPENQRRHFDSKVHKAQKILSANLHKGH